MTRAAKNSNGNGKNGDRKFNTQQSLDSYIKSVCDIMRRSNCAGASTSLKLPGCSSSASSTNNNTKKPNKPKQSVHPSPTLSNLPPLARLGSPLQR
jgi:hypothetical protein